MTLSVINLCPSPAIVFNEDELASFGGDNGVSERPLPLAISKASRRKRSAPFELPAEPADTPALA